MKPTPFRMSIDLAPIPFGRDLCLAAKGLKEAGLLWRPHVGCFVWDELEIIKPPSPFPERIYFVLNLGHFHRRFGTVENMVEKLVWLPTWHQARLIYKEMGTAESGAWDEVCASMAGPPGRELLVMYKLILEKLEEQQRKEVDARAKSD